MFLSGEWSKQVITGIVTGALLNCAIIGHAESLGVVLVGSQVQGPEATPTWWKNRGVLDDQKPQANASLVNIGQLKWVTRQLHEELSALLPAEASLFALDQINPTTPDAYKAVMPYDPNFPNWKSGNQATVQTGQLKNSAAKFYDALFAISPAWLSDQLTRSGHPADGRKYPWTDTIADDANNAPANIGQLKSVFSLRLRESLDDDLLPDIFELALIKYVPEFAGKTLNDITWKPGDAKISLKGTDAAGNATTKLTSRTAPNFGGAQNGVLSAAALLAEHEAVGSVGGSFAVGGDGAANYAVPIKIPKGTSGVEPQLALSYSSAAGNGSLGVGFDISGLQRITRGPTSRLKDGFVDSVDFDDNDRFFFDGELLIATSKPGGAAATAADYGKDGTVYQTESNSFARIISMGQRGSGPAYWIVETKAGLRIELGNSEQSQVATNLTRGAIVWNVNRVSDNVGNYYVVEYQLDSGGGPLDYRLARVKYTGNGSILPYNEVRFDWQDRPDVSQGIVEGIKIRNAKRLEKISVFTNNSLLYTYQLEYFQKPSTGASCLSKIQKINNDGSRLPPTVFSWKSDKPLATATTAQQPATEWNNGTGNDQDKTPSVDYLGSKVNGFLDMNADGLPDRVTNKNGTDLGIWVSLNTGAGFSPPQKWMDSPPAIPVIPPYIAPPTLNLLAQPTDGTITVYKNKGKWYNYANLPKYPARIIPPGAAVYPNYYKLTTSSHWESIDIINWARQVDWDYYNINNYNNQAIMKNHASIVQQMWDNANALAEEQTQAQNYFVWNDAGSQLGGFMDINNDGLPDRVNYRNGANFGLFVALNTGSSFAPVSNWLSATDANCPELKNNYFAWSHDGNEVNGFIDMNGDGLPDRVCHYNWTTQAYGLWVSINTGSSFAPATNWLTGFRSEEYFFAWRWNGSQINGFIDLNGDNLPDRVHYSSGDLTGNQPGLWVSINTGTGYAAPTKWAQIEQREEEKYFNWNDQTRSGTQVNGFVDMNGDGLPDRVTGRASTDPNANGLWVALNTGLSFAPEVRWTNLITAIAPYDNNGQLSGFVDLNGDGLLDCYTSNSSVLINTGSGFGPPISWGVDSDNAGRFSTTVPSTDPVTNVVNIQEGTEVNGFADFNGDGLPDRVTKYNYYVGDNSPGIWVGLNTGTSFAAAKKWYQSSRSEDNSFAWKYQRSDIAGFIDLNGDGLLDRVAHRIYPTDELGLWVTLNTGSGFGKSEVVDDTGDRIDSIKDGLGAEIKIEYKRGSNASLDDYGRPVYTKSNDNTPGLTNINGAGYLVSRYAEQDGLGGYRWKRQYYGERKLDRVKEEDMGFKWTESIDEQRGYGSITTHSQQFPYQGLPLESISYIPSGTAKIITSKQTFSYAKQADIPGIGGKVRFTYQQSTTSRDYAFEGASTTVPTLASNTPRAPVFIGNELSWATATNGAFDDWGNLLSSSSISSDGFSTTNTNTYEAAITAPSAGKWILGRLKNATVTKSGPAGYTPVTKTSEFTYYTSGLHNGMLQSELAEPSDASAVRKSYTYDAWGNKDSTTITALNGDQAPRTSYVKYDATGRFAIEESNQLGHKVSYEYDSTRALLLATTGANGISTRFFYDAWGTKILTRGADGTESAAISRYATAGDVATATAAGLDPATQKIVFIKKSQGTGAAAATAYIDAQGRVLMSSAESYDGRPVFSRADHDVFGRQFRQSQPFFLGETLRWATTSFDEAGRPLSSLAPDGSVSSISYQGLTSVGTNPIGQTQTSTRNTQGWLTSTKDNAGNQTDFTYSVDGKPKQTTAPGNHVVTTNLDIFGQKKSMTDSDVGSSSSDYFAFGEIKKTTDAKGATTEFTYDILGRQLTRIVRDSAGVLDSTTITTYDTAPGAGKGKAHTVEMKNGTGTVTYLSSVRYDVLGRATETTVAQRGETFKSSVTYDAIGRVLTETDAGGLTILHEYNARGFQTGIRDYLTGELYWKPLSYDASGRLLTEQLGNGVINTQTYDQARGTLLQSQAKKDTAILQDMSYEWDAIGTLKKRSDLRQSLIENFDYDSLNRLTGSQVTGKARLAFSYSVSGNILSKANVGSYGYTGARPHAVSNITGVNGVNRTFDYDANGSLTIEKRNGQQYREVVWTAHAEVRSFSLTGGPRVLNVNGTELFAAGNTTTSFEYDAGFSRSQKITERDQLQREVTLYLGSYERIVSENRASSGLAYTTQKVEHRHSIGGLALKTFTEQAGVTSEDTVYYLKDHLGSITGIVGKDGIVKERYSFDAWGARRDATTWADSAFDKLTKVTATNRGYTGHEMLDEIGLVHMNGRIYDPEIGRVLSGDPLIQAPDNSQSFNRYSYCINNPLSLTDPSGYSWFSKLWNKFTNFLLKPFRYVNEIRKLVFNKIVKWLGEHQWAAIVVAVVVGIVTLGIGTAVAGALLAGTALAGSLVATAVIAGAIGGFISGAVNAALAGGGFRDILKGGLVGAFQGAASGALHFVGGIANVIGHGLVGGVANKLMGGSFQDGFVSAAAGAAVNNILDGLGLYGEGKFLGQPGDKDLLRTAARTTIAGIAGGTAAAIGGGKFSNGFYTAALQHLFNAENGYYSIKERLGRMRDQLVQNARSLVGSTKWAPENWRFPYTGNIGSTDWSSNKCNVFCGEMVRDAGMLQGFRKNTLFSWLSAESWYSGESAGWTQVDSPLSGDIITDGHHMGIVSGKNTSISSASSGKILENDWGFRDQRNIRYFRYEGQIVNDQRVLTSKDVFDATHPYGLCIPEGCP
jgi:RHS repeat-associated protein